jgi:hypothetical protein
MKKWIILRMALPDDVRRHQNKHYIISRFELQDLVACDDDGELMIFDDLQSAFDYQEVYGISGQCVELPIY